MNNPDKVEIYQVNTIANYDPNIIPFLKSPVHSAFGRDKKTWLFVEEEYDQE